MVTTDKLEKLNGHLEKLSTETTVIVHATDFQASVVNETTWELKEDFERWNILNRTCGALEWDLRRLENKLELYEKKKENILLMDKRAGAAYKAVHRGLD